MEASTPRRRYKPDFPSRNYIELQRTKFNLGDQRITDYTTTYQAMLPKRDREDVEQKIDTKMLQRTHWTAGDLDTSGSISEMKAEYVRHRGVVTPEPAMTRDSMMQTTFELGDGSGLNIPNKEFAVAHGRPEQQNLREFMTSTHFDLTNSDPVWESTHHSSYRPMTAQPSRMADMNLRAGRGTKDTMELGNAFPANSSLEHDTYRPIPRSRDATSVNERATIEGDTVSFHQNTGHKWQRTNMKMGDGVDRFSTTYTEQMKPKPRCDVDPRFATKTKLALQHSCLADGYRFPSEKSTTMRDAHTPHPECRPPPMAEKTAFLSHHDYRNWDGRPKTTMQEAYYPKKAEKVDPVNNQLQESHAAFGNPQINEKTTLYDASYQRPTQTMELADVNAARDFHMGHHSRDSETNVRSTGKTVNQVTYIGCPGGKASDMCDALKGGHNIVANEPRFNGRQSAMKEDYVKYKGVHHPPPIDNFLQQSHLQLKGCAQPWSTTQQDYFLFDTYKMPGDLM